jgi:hypothetical protein
MALQHIGEEIWIADGPKVPFYGFPYPTRMAVIRLADGGLWVWSPVGLDRELRTEVETLGPVRHLVSPNKLHHLFLADWGAAVIFFHRQSSTCLVCDLIQRHDPAECTGWKGMLMRLDGLVGPDGSTPREWRASFIKRSRARAALRRALSWQPERLVIAHGEWAPTDGTEMLRRGIRWLKP